MNWNSLLIPVCLLLLLIPCAGHGDAITTPNGSILELPVGVEPVEFASGKVLIQAATGEHVLKVEIAATRQQISRGLMYRSALPEAGGMLFVYPIAHRGRFWMFNTVIPLSVAYADQRGVIFQISDLVPCVSLSELECIKQATTARQPFHLALEVVQGYFARRGVGIGDRIEYQYD